MRCSSWFVHLLPALSLLPGCAAGARGEVGIYVDAGGDREGDVGSQSGDGGASPGLDVDGGRCGASADVKAVRKPATVWLIVETSLAIADVNDEAFGRDVTAWTALREVLLGSQGLVPAFESVVKFGVVFHSASSTRICPSLRVLEPALNNGAQLNAIYLRDSADFWGGTGGSVTYKALDFIAQHLGQTDSTTEDSSSEILIIAKTTGESLCAEDSSSVPGRANQLVRERLTSVVAQKISAFVVRLPLLTDTSVAFENELARIGGTEKAYTPMNAAEMRLDFEKILRDSVSCEITLNGDVTDGSECQGTVEVDGVEIPCSSEDGWRLKDPRTIELVGSACTDLRSRPTAQIKADFPCGIILF